MEAVATAEQSVPDGHEGHYLVGRIAHVRYHNPASDFTSLLIHREREDGTHERVRAAGPLPRPATGEEVHLFGRFTPHPPFARVFHFSRFTSRLPVDAPARAEYLSRQSGLSPRQAQAALAHFGLAAVELLAQAPDRFAEVPGIDAATARAAGERFDRHHRDQHVADLLTRHGIPDHLLSDLAGRGERSNDPQQDLRNNPYRLLLAFTRVRFRAIDQVARELGVDDHADRLAAAAMESLRRHARAGHTRVSQPDVSDLASRICGSSPEAATFEEALQSLVDRELVLRDDTHLALVEYAGHEQRCARALARLAHSERNFDVSARRIDRLLGDAAPALRAAVRTAITNPLTTIDTPRVPTTAQIVSLLTHTLGRLGLSWLLVNEDPRLQHPLREALGTDPARVATLLQWEPPLPPRHDRDHPLPADALLVTAADRLSTEALGALATAMAPGGLLILIGDALELPPVEPGAPFCELVEHGLSAHASLHPSTSEPPAPTLAGARRALASGAPLDWPTTANASASLWFVEIGEAEIRATIETFCERVLPRMGGRARRTRCIAALNNEGLFALNADLQALNNPDGETLHGSCVRVGDPAYITTDSPLGPAGTECRVERLEAGPRAAVRRLDDTRLVLDQAHTRQLRPGYARPPNLPAGRTFPTVVLALPRRYATRLTRAHLYHAAATASERLIVFSDRPSLDHAVSRVAHGRHTAFRDYCMRARAALESLA